MANRQKDCTLMRQAISKLLDSQSVEMPKNSALLQVLQPTTTTPMYHLVTGIIYTNDKPSAVIGNRVVYEGNTFQGINVVKIYKDKVEFEKDGKRWTQSIEDKPATDKK